MCVRERFFSICLCACIEESEQTEREREREREEGGSVYARECVFF